jgi:YjbE family integral membrane protein
MAAASLSPELRKKAIVYGMVVAAILRILFAIFATYLLAIKGLLFLGGLLLLFVSWRLWQEIQIQVIERAGRAQEVEGYQGPPRRTLLSALISITIADFSMSIDNVLAVAAIARDNTAMLVFGLILAITLMGFGATLIVKLLTKYHWISYLGLVVLLITAGRMLWDGWGEMAHILGLG